MEIRTHRWKNALTYGWKVGKMADLEELACNWSLLPSDVVVHVFSFLPMKERNSVSRVCKAWHQAFGHPYLWHSFDFWFLLPSHVRLLEGLIKYGRYIKSVFIGVNQLSQVNRENACALMDQLSKIGKRRLTRIEIVFTGENPLFYSGQEFLDGLFKLFSPVSESIEPPLNTLSHVDLCGITVPIDDRLINILADNHKGLQYFDIQNKVIVCKVTPGCILRLVKICRYLLDLRLYHCSMSDYILDAFTKENREKNIEHLSIMCRREDKFGTDLSAMAWKNLASANPSFRVTLGFDHTCPFNIIPIIMKPVIPVRTLKLETFAECHEEVTLAAMYYSSTLVKLVLRTRNTMVLEEALIKVAQSCTLLKALLVFCVVSEETIEEIFRLHPDMKTRGTFILKSVVEPEPWVVGVEEGD
ncbi:F-box/LRR-repeat protein 3-like isoform X1 [Dreissena polymorpha]|uniref:F-box/LRR-repeat protein 3-like isoform X1 n=2 Tax=Dreissena polymorpha TaxID=45954 RepID=UPI002263B0F7|nr:F-box/LRR-repeat protein 3-like isoform X1 [Dreissena polymorpha]